MTGRPNTTLQPTSGALRIQLFASWLSRRSRLSGRPLVRQAKLGASGRVKVPAEQGLTIHSYRVLQRQLRRVKPDKSVEAYTGKHAGRRRDRELQSLIQPRHGV